MRRQDAYSQRVNSAGFYQGEEPDDLLLFFIVACEASDGGSLRLADALRRPPEPARLGRCMINLDSGRPV